MGAASQDVLVIWRSNLYFLLQSSWKVILYRKLESDGAKIWLLSNFYRRLQEDRLQIEPHVNLLHSLKKNAFVWQICYEFFYSFFLHFSTDLLRIVFSSFIFSFRGSPAECTSRQPPALFSPFLKPFSHFLLQLMHICAQSISHPSVRFLSIFFQTSMPSRHPLSGNLAFLPFPVAITHLILLILPTSVQYLNC